MELDDAIDRFRGPLIGLILSWGAPSTDAIEIALDSLADAYLYRQKCSGDVRDPVVFGRWLRGVAKNKYANWARTRSRRERRVRLVPIEELDNHSGTTASDAIDPRVQLLREEIERLPRKQREVILMHYLEETAVADVAAILSVTPKAVEGRLFQARRRLRQRLVKTPSNVQWVKAILL